MASYMLGKQEAKLDSRTISLKKLLIKKLLPPLPETFNVDDSFLYLNDNRMFANDIYGNCVIAGRAHMTMRFECFEQNQLINISDNEVIDQYFYESGGQDSGLIMLDSLKIWRKLGWWAGTKAYNIYAFAKINPKNHEELKSAIYLLYGAYVGLQLPISASKQLNNDKIWDVVDGEEGKVGSWGGHCVYIHAYNEVGPVCMTWGKKQQMTWNFWNRYCDEAYAIIDNKNIYDAENNPLNLTKLKQYLEEICGEEVDVNPNPPNPPKVDGSQPWYYKILAFFAKIGVIISSWFNK